MSNMELEMKILNVNENEIANKIKNLGGKYISTSKQFLYVYDFMYINQRYLANLYEFNNEESIYRKDIILNKFKNLFFEIEQLLDDNNICFLKDNFNVSNLSNILNLPIKDITNILNNSIFIDFISKFKKTPNKWIRLRKTIEEDINKQIIESTTLVVKHVLKNNNSGIQQMKETEIEVNSIEETNELLEDLGFAYKSYQEKKRIKYVLNDHEIDIDTWPNLPTYFEVEGKDKKDLENILNLLGYSFEEAVSCTADALYRQIGIDINNMKELKF